MVAGRAAKRALVASAVAIGLAAGLGGAIGANMMITATGGALRVPVVSMAESRFRTVVRQQYDFSCGSAALATLLTHHYGIDTLEQDAVRGMIAVGDQEKIRREGFSMLEMKAYLASRGIRADGFEAGLDQMVEVGLPAIVLVNIKGYMHFVVVKGIAQSEVLVGDPALGLKSYETSEFNRLRVGTVALYLVDAVPRGTASFNRVTEWGLIGRAPVTMAIRHEQLLGSQMLMLPRPNEF